MISCSKAICPSAATSIRSARTSGKNDPVQLSAPPGQLRQTGCHNSSVKERNGMKGCNSRSAVSNAANKFFQVACALARSAESQLGLDPFRCTSRRKKSPQEKSDTRREPLHENENVRVRRSPVHVARREPREKIQRSNERKPGRFTPYGAAGPPLPESSQRFQRFAAGTLRTSPD